MYCHKTVNGLMKKKSKGSDFLWFIDFMIGFTIYTSVGRIDIQQ